MSDDAAAPRAAGVSLRKAIDAKCRACGGAGAGNWRGHVAVCRVLACPLWRVRPLPAGAPSWIRSRDPADLPGDWKQATIEAANACMKAEFTRETAMFSHIDDEGKGGVHLNASPRDLRTPRGQKTRFLPRQRPTEPSIAATNSPETSDDR